MHALAASSVARHLRAILGWRRIGITIGISIGFGLLFSYGWTSGLPSLLSRTVLLGLVALLVFGLFERWPGRLPRWLERWVLQVIGVALATTISAAAIYWLSTAPGAPP